MAIFKFYCDASHDSTNAKRKPDDAPFEPRSFVVSGFFSDAPTWDKLERAWVRRNALEGVPRFHASHLNAGTWEYDGWSKPRRIAYSKAMLEIFKKAARHGRDQQKKIHGVSIGLFVDEYRKIISPEGQIKMGPPELLCFKSVLMTLASQMDYGGFRPEDQVAVIFDRGEHDAEAVRLFYETKDSSFRHRHRLATCTPGSSEEFIGLQVADLLAYETFRLMHSRRDNRDVDMRAPIKALLGMAGYLGFAFGKQTLSNIKDDVDALQCKPNGFFLIPPYLSEEEGRKLAQI